MPFPGVFTRGATNFSKGSVVHTSFQFNEDGTFEWVHSPKLPAQISVLKGKVTISINGRAAYAFKIVRDNAEVLDGVRSTDTLVIESLDENGNSSPDFMDQLFVTPDECSA